jgi:twitching motility protein PilU
MEQSARSGIADFRAGSLPALSRGQVITLDEALTNADSPTNLSWLINNSEITTSSQEGRTHIARSNRLSSFRTVPTTTSGVSFKEFSLSLNDADDERQSWTADSPTRRVALAEAAHRMAVR